MVRKYFNERFYFMGIAFISLVLLFGAVFLFNEADLTDKTITGYGIKNGGGSDVDYICESRGVCKSVTNGAGNYETKEECLSSEECRIIRYKYVSESGGKCIEDLSGAYTDLKKCEYDNCVSWSSSNPNCAVKGKTCPDGWTLNDDVCCEPGTEPTSKLGYNLCEGTNDYCESQGKKFCEGGFPAYVDVCCPSEMFCTKSGGVAYCANNDGNKCNSEAGETLCADDLCCKSNEGCASSSGVGFCYPKTADSCMSTQTFCAGSVDGIGEINLCCDSGETCEHYPNGAPFCYKKS